MPNHVRSLTRASSLCVVAALAGCTEYLIPSDLSIACDSEADCPSGYRCPPSVQRCLPPSNDNAAPSLVEPNVFPALGGRDSCTTISFEVDEPLLLAPEVIVSSASLGDLKAEDGPCDDAPPEACDDGRVCASFRPSDVDAIAEAEAGAHDGLIVMSARLIDRAGNETPRAFVGGFTLDTLPPSAALIGELTYIADEDAARRDITAARRGTQLRFTVEVIDDGSTTLDVTPLLSSTAPLVIPEGNASFCSGVGPVVVCDAQVERVPDYEDTEPLTDGEYELLLSMRDAAKNESTVAVGTFTIDQTPPDPPDVSAPDALILERLYTGSSALSASPDLASPTFVLAVFGDAELQSELGRTRLDTAAVQQDGRIRLGLPSGQIDRVFVSLIDDAGNASVRVRVRNVLRGTEELPISNLHRFDGTRTRGNGNFGSYGDEDFVIDQTAPAAERQAPATGAVADQSSGAISMVIPGRGLIDLFPYNSVRSDDDAWDSTATLTYSPQLSSLVALDPSRGVLVVDNYGFQAPIEIGTHDSRQLYPIPSEIPADRHCLTWSAEHLIHVAHVYDSSDLLLQRWDPARDDGWSLVTTSSGISTPIEDYVNCFGDPTSPSVALSDSLGEVRIGRIHLDTLEVEIVGSTADVGGFATARAVAQDGDGWLVAVSDQNGANGYLNAATRVEVWRLSAAGSWSQVGPDVLRNTDVARFDTPALQDVDAAVVDPNTGAFLVSSIQFTDVPEDEPTRPHIMFQFDGTEWRRFEMGPNGSAYGVFGAAGDGTLIGWLSSQLAASRGNAWRTVGDLYDGAAAERAVPFGDGALIAQTDTSTLLRYDAGAVTAFGPSIGALTTATDLAACTISGGVLIFASAAGTVTEIFVADGSSTPSVQVRASLAGVAVHDCAHDPAANLTLVVGHQSGNAVTFARNGSSYDLVHSEPRDQQASHRPIAYERTLAAIVSLNGSEPASYEVSGAQWDGSAGTWILRGDTKLGRVDQFGAYVHTHPDSGLLVHFGSQTSRWMPHESARFAVLSRLDLRGDYDRSAEVVSIDLTFSSGSGSAPGSPGVSLHAWNGTAFDEIAAANGAVGDAASFGDVVIGGAYAVGPQGDVIVAIAAESPGDTITGFAGGRVMLRLPERPLDRATAVGSVGGTTIDVDDTGRGYANFWGEAGDVYWEIGSAEERIGVKLIAEPSHGSNRAFDLAAPIPERTPRISMFESSNQELTAVSGALFVDVLRVDPATEHVEVRFTLTDAVFESEDGSVTATLDGAFSFSKGG